MSGAVILLAQLNAATFATMRNVILLALIFTLLAKYAPACNKTPPWWRKPDLSTDLCWLFLPNLLYRYAQLLMVSVGIMLCYGISQPGDVARFLTQGHGPVSQLGFWPQVMIDLLGSDLILYATHRMFHSVRLWRFHAVHHSSRQLEWISATRFHPVDAILHGSLPDVLMLLLGVPPDVLAWIVPFNVASSALVHANLGWRFGPFRYVLASPVFHRWHHTSEVRGGGSNFAATFPFIDLAFGTFYMPADQHPDSYGIDDPGFPADFARQLLHPFLPAQSRGARAGQRPVTPPAPAE